MNLFIESVRTYDNGNFQVGHWAVKNIREETNTFDQNKTCFMSCFVVQSPIFGGFHSAFGLSPVKVAISMILRNDNL